jgi:spermidine synthase
LNCARPLPALRASKTRMLLDTRATAVAPKVESRATSLLVLYGMTGFSGLIAEQVLEKYVTLLVGATASASAAVIFTYFLGFAVGGLAAARLLKRGSVQNPLRAYAGIELLTGCACVVFSFAFPTAMSLLAPLQNLVIGEFGKYLVRFVCGCLLVLPIAAMMGASFPLLAQALDDMNTNAPRRWSVAYSANLAGAVLASLAAPFVLFPVIGLRGAMWLCFAICAAVALFVQLRGSSASPQVRPKSSMATAFGNWQPGYSHLLIAAFLSGCVFFALEIIWIHLVGAVVGGSIYAFSWMLTGVLIGLWGGSWIANRSKDLRPARVLLLCAFALLIQLAAWPLAPALFVLAPKAIAVSFYPRELYRLLVACILIVPSAVSLGLIYPTLLKSPLVSQAHGDRETSAWFAGYMSAANSLGCLAGALLSTFLLIDRLGSELSLKIVTLVIAALWLVFEFRDPNIRQSGKRLGNTFAAAALAAMLVAGVYMTRWNWGYLTSGASMYFGENAAAWTDTAPATGPAVTTSMVFRDESVQGGFTTVLLKQTESAGSRGHSSINLYTNGKLQGNDDQIGMVQGQQVGTAVLPSLFTAHFHRALLIGLGTGRAAAVLKQLGFEQLDIAELSPGIVRAVGTEFHHANHSVLSDPTVHCTLEDGRNLLLTSGGARYDLITIGLTTIWFSGATNLYSKEFYELARRHLAEDGVLQQWVQLHRIGPEEIASAIASVRAVFPYVSYWNYEGAGMVLAANHPLDLQAAQGEHLAAALHQRGGMAFQDAQDLMDRILRGQLLSERGVDRMLQQMRPVINTDQNRHLEYATPRYSSAERDWEKYNVDFLKQWERQQGKTSER